MKISNIEVFHCDGGWRTWAFVKIQTDEGITGWSECTDAFGSTTGVKGVIKDLGTILLGKDPREYEKLFWDMYAVTRQSPGSVVQKGIAGIENALLDIAGKSYGVPVYKLFGGPIREKIPLYWSHCGTTRVRAAEKVGKSAIKSLEDITAFGEEIKKSGYKAIKTNPAFFGESSFIYMPGFNRSAGGPELNVSKEILDRVQKYMAAWRKGVGEGIELILDLNFNFKPEGYIRLGRALEEFNLMWLELDCYDPESLRLIRDSLTMPICSGEVLYGNKDFRPFFEKRAMDIASIDVTWNGFAQSKKIADTAQTYEMNVAPHNHHSHLGTFISGNFSASIPNLRILETDVDDVSWKDELVTNIPTIENGELVISKAPGWGTEINEEVLKQHPAK